MNGETLSIFGLVFLIMLAIVVAAIFLIWFIYRYDTAVTKHNAFSKKKETDGLFILDDSDPNTTRWILDVKMDPDEIKNKKEIRLKVCKMENQGDV